MLYKIVLVTMVILGKPFINCDGMNAIRMAYHNVKTEAQLTELLHEIEIINCIEKEPYLASTIMRQAEFTSWPHKKLKYFKEGKALLEDFILKHPNSIEGRYIRLLTQTNAPSFLNYNNEILEDKQFIEAHIEASNLPEDYKNKMKQNIYKHTNK
ncbi:hypothetical protein [Tamlana sp. I1]|uniref:hypothetical protein n=1 Tax=Tamlana sp. I1 TaxID=2762061 RepID=UPI00188F9154|nr:hypothetical protein [Tamlana sp. I1]